MTDDDEDDLFSPGAARWTDPDTSHDAADSVDATRMESLVHDVVLKRGELGATWDEVYAVLHWIAKATISPRWKPLRRKGWIAAKIDANGDVEKRDGVSGRGQTVWVAVHGEEAVAAAAAAYADNQTNFKRDRVGEFGRMTCLAHGKDWVMARYANCDPFCIPETEWLDLPRYIKSSTTSEKDHSNERPEQQSGFTPRAPRSG